MTTTIGIINFNQSEYVYYLIKNIQKIEGNNCKIKVVDNGKSNKIYNIIDDVDILRNNDNEFFDTDSLEYEDIFAKSIQLLIDNCDTEQLVILHPNAFLKHKISELDFSKNTIACNYYNDSVDICCIVINIEKYKAKYQPIESLKSFTTDVKNDRLAVKLQTEKYIIMDNNPNFVERIKSKYDLFKTDYYDVILSLTTYKGRINDETTQKVIYSLLLQKTSFKYKVVLVLSEEEFSNKETIPSYLKAYQNEFNNFEILWTYKNTRPLKKLDPTMEKYPNIPIITLDDDDLCKSNLVEYMMCEHIKNPFAVLGEWIENTFNFIKWVAAVRLWPPHSLYQFPLEDYTEYYNGILDDNFNAMRCAFKMTPVCSVEQHSEKANQTDLKLSKEYENTNWGKCYRRFIMDHLDQLPEDLYYI